VHSTGYFTIGSYSVNFKLSNSRSAIISQDLEVIQVKLWHSENPPEQVCVTSSKLINSGLLMLILVLILVSISTHLLSNTPLFTRAILMSGNTTLRSIRKRSWHNSFYERNIKMLGLDNISPKERKLALYSMSIEELTNRLPMFQHWSPAIDGKFLVKEVNLGILGNVNDPTGKPYWCKEIVVGDTLHDVVISTPKN